MATVPQLNGKRVAVMGLGKSGTSAARMLSESGAVVVAWDDNEAARKTAAAEGVAIQNLTELNFAGLDLILWSPGIPHTHPKPHPVAEKARAAGVPLVCDVELLALAQPNARFVGITGTNGKSTTTTLIAHILKSAGAEVAVGGNLGTPALDLPLLNDNGIYVLELSSYQLELLDKASFDVAVMLNLTPDHLSRHGGMEGYFAAKASLFQRLRNSGTAVVGVDDTYGQRLAASLKNVVRVSVRESVEGVQAAGGIMTDHGKTVLDLTMLPILPGRHNWQNVCCAYAATKALGLAVEDLIAGIESYPGLAHRQEWVATIDGIRYVNDSKATNADAAEKAMLCYQHIYWIIGGQAKEGGIDSLEPLFGRIAKAFLIGEAASAFAQALDGKAAYEQCGTLEAAVAKAHLAALANGPADAVVLLSPACASWDQFKSFEHRGEVFRDLVNALPGKRSATP